MPKKQIAKKPDATATGAPRRLPPPAYKSFRLSKRIRHPAAPVKGSFRLLGGSLRHLWRHKGLFAGLSIIYLIANLLLVREFNLNHGVVELRAGLEGVFQGAYAPMLLGLTLFGALVEAGATPPSPAGGAYHSVLLVVFSLAVIWALRQTFAGRQVSLRDVLYKSMHPFIPYLLVMVVIALQLVPALIGATLYGIVEANDLAVNFAEQAVWILLFGLLALLSLYMITSSAIALYVVALPDMTPLRALRSARELVRFRRWQVMRKMLFAPLALLVLAAVVMLPFLLWLTPAADYVFFAISPLGLVVFHAYMYSLYRELL